MTSPNSSQKKIKKKYSLTQPRQGGGLSVLFSYASFFPLLSMYANSNASLSLKYSLLPFRLLASSPVSVRLIGLGLGFLGGLLHQLFLADDAGLGADAAEHEPHADRLHGGQAVAEGDDRDDHGEHLARDGDGHEQDGGEGGQSVDYCRRKEKGSNASATDTARKGFRGEREGGGSNSQIKTCPMHPHRAKPSTSLQTAG